MTFYPDIFCLVLVVGALIHVLSEALQGLTASVARDTGFPPREMWPDGLYYLLNFNVILGALVGALWPLAWMMFQNPAQGASAMFGAVLSDLLATHVVPTMRKMKTLLTDGKRNSLGHIWRTYLQVRVPGTDTAPIQVAMLVLVGIVMCTEHLTFSILFFVLGTLIFLGFKTLFKLIRKLLWN